jgi:hypothetical protein
MAVSGNSQHCGQQNKLGCQWTAGHWNVQAYNDKTYIGQVVGGGLEKYFV